MQIILLNNGTGISRGETSYLRSGKIAFEFIGAPNDSVITVSCGDRIMRQKLPANKVVYINTSELLGDVRLIVSTRDKIWHCDNVRVEKNESGDITVYALTKYADHIKNMSDALYKMQTDIDDLHRKYDSLRTNEESEHQII